MDRGCLTFTAASSAPPRLTFLRRGAPNLRQCYDNSRKSAAKFSCTSRNHKGSLRVKALNQSLSSDWDVSSYAPPSWLPRFEDLDTTNMLLRQRIIFLGSQIDDVTADFVISQLLLLDSEDHKKDIRLFINSPGGSVTAGLGIYDAMKLCKADVSTVCMGLAASMGAFLLASGSKGKRFCMPNARVMIHQPLGTAGGNATDMSIRIREMSYHKLKLNKILSRVTGKPEHQIELDTDRDNFMSAWEAKEYGLVDEVIDDGKPGLIAPTVDASPPPKTRISDLWKIEGTKKPRKNLPSEERISQDDFAVGGGNEEKVTWCYSSSRTIKCTLRWYLTINEGLEDELSAIQFSSSLSAIMNTTTVQKYHQKKQPYHQKSSHNKLKAR